MKTIKLTGTPEARGAVHGETFRTQIAQLAALRRELLEGYFKRDARSTVDQLAREQVTQLDAYPPLREEFKGIARASGVSPEDLAILNNYTDMRDFSWKLNQDEGCSAFSVHTRQQGKTSAICGQTWDMHGSAEPYMLHMSIDGDSRTPLQEVLTLTGCLGLAGVNSHGVSVLINNLHTRETGPGMIWPALVRMILEARSAALGLETLARHLPAGGHNYMICDPAGAINVETTGQRLDVTARVREEGTVLHTNHYVGRLKSTEIEDRRSKSSDRRLAELDSLNLSDTGQVAEAVFGPRCPGINIEPSPTDPHASATCGGIVLDLTLRKGTSYVGRYSSNDRHSFSW